MEPKGEMIGGKKSASETAGHAWSVKEAFSTYFVWGSILSFFCSCFSEFPVSYTHLDVYKRQVEIVPVYQQGGILPGEYVTGHISKYLQNISETDLTYNAAPSDTKYVKMISGSNIIFKNFAETYDGQGDAYTYYLNMEHTTSAVYKRQDQR